MKKKKKGLLEGDLEALLYTAFQSQFIAAIAEPNLRQVKIGHMDGEACFIHVAQPTRPPLHDCGSRERNFGLNVKLLVSFIRTQNPE